MRAGQISDSYSYDPFGEITAVTHDGTAKTPLEAQNDNGLSDNDVLWGYNGARLRRKRVKRQIRRQPVRRAQVRKNLPARNLRRRSPEANGTNSNPM